MDKIKKISLPLKAKELTDLKAGESVFLSGIILTARDQAHLRLSESLKSRRTLPVDLKGQIIYYCGPTPAKDGVIGSCGPTTSGRMDEFTPLVLAGGVKGMIGKGKRSEEVRKAIKKNGAVYFVAPAGAGAYLKKKVTACKKIAFKDLGPEAIYELKVKDFPVVVAIDSRGKDIYAP